MHPISSSSAGMVADAAHSPSSPRDARAAHRLAAGWAFVHLLPLLLLPVLTHTLGAAFGLDRGAAVTHGVTVALLPILQGRLMRDAWAGGAWWTGRALLALIAACGVAMVVMSTVDLMGYDAAATPVAMCLAGIVHGALLGWPLRRTRWLAPWLGASAAGWLLGTAGYRLLLAHGLGWTIRGQSAYGYAYVGGHNELLWIGAGLAGFGIVTGLLMARRIPTARAP